MQEPPNIKTQFRNRQRKTMPTRHESSKKTVMEPTPQRPRAMAFDSLDELLGMPDALSTDISTVAVKDLQDSVSHSVVSDGFVNAVLSRNILSTKSPLYYPPARMGTWMREDTTKKIQHAGSQAIGLLSHKKPATVDTAENHVSDSEILHKFDENGDAIELFKISEREESDSRNGYLMEV